MTITDLVFIVLVLLTLFHVSVKSHSVVTGVCTQVYVEGGQEDGPRPWGDSVAAGSMGQKGAAESAPTKNDERAMGITTSVL